MHDLVKLMSKADQAYEQVVESGGSIQQAAVAYLMTSLAARPDPADPDRAKAARYVLLYREYLTKPRMAVEHAEFKSLWQHFQVRGWNYSAVELYAKTGRNSHTG